MDGIRLDKAMDWLLLAAVIVTSMGIFTFLWRILRTVSGAVIAIPIVVLVFLFAFGIIPAHLRHEVMRLGHEIWWKFSH